MNILFKYIRSNVKARKLRSLVMLLSIVLSTTLLFVSLSIGESYASAQRKMARGMAGSASLAVTRSGGAPLESGLLARSPHVAHAAGIVQTLGLYKEDGYYENFDVVAADMDGLKDINEPRILSGTTGGFEGDRIVLPERFTTKFGVGVGDTLTLFIGGEPHDFEIAAIAANDTAFLRHTRGTTALVPRQTLCAILGIDEAYTQLLVEPVGDIDTAQAALQAELPAGYEVRRVVNEAQVEAGARQKSMPFYLICFFSLTLSVFIIYSSYNVITVERLPVIGTFRSIGATQRDVGGILLLESLVYGIGGAALGLPAGLIALQILVKGLGGALAQGVEIPVVVSPLSALLACGVAAGVSVSSAWIPIRRASRLPVKDVVLGHVEEPALSDARRFAAGALCLVLAAVLPAFGKRAGDPLLAAAGGLSLLGLIAGTLLMIPAVTQGASRVLERLYGALSNEGRLAARNLRDNKSVCQNITLLFISVSAVIAITVVGSFVQTYIGDVFRGAKLDGFTDATLPPALVEEIKALDGIDEVLPVQVLYDHVRMNDAPLARVEGTDDIALYAEMFAMTYERGSDRTRIEDMFAAGRGVLLSAKRMKAAGVKPGDTVTLSAQGGSFPYTVLGIFKVRSTDADAIISSACAKEDMGARNYGIVAYTAPNPDAVMAQIRDLFADRSHWSRTVAEFNQDALGTVNAFLAPMRNLTGFILALAAVGIMNNLLINHIQRRRMTAMYRSVGMSGRQGAKIILIEGFSTGLIGALIAMGISWLEIQTIFLVAGPRISVQPELETGAFLWAGALGVIITLLGALAPIARGRGLRLVDEIQFE